MPASGRVAVSVNREGGWWIVSVSHGAKRRSGQGVGCVKKRYTPQKGVCVSARRKDSRLFKAMLAANRNEDFLLTTDVYFEALFRLEAPSNVSSNQRATILSPIRSHNQRLLNASLV